MTNDIDSTIPRVGIKDLTKILKHMPRNQTALVLGPAGCGKSECITQTYSELGYWVEPLHLAAMEASDLLGLPIKKEIEDGKTITTFATPYFFNIPKGEKLCLFLDEIARMKVDVMQIVLQLILEHRVGPHMLPEDTVIISASNIGIEYFQNSFDRALLSRLNIIYLDITKSQEDFLNFCKHKRMDQRLYSFLNENRNFIDSDGITRGEDFDFPDFYKLPDRRAYFKLDSMLSEIETETLLSNKEFYYVLFSSVIGVPVAQKLFSYLSKTQKNTITAIDIFHDFSKCKDNLANLTLEDLCKISYEVYEFLESSDKIPEEKNFFEFIKYLEENKPEIFAKNVDLISSTRYEKAVGRIVKHYPATVRFIKDSLEKR